MKPHHGRIVDWEPWPCKEGLGYFIVGKLIDHPTLSKGGRMAHTSFVVQHDEKTGEIETNNSRYRLIIREGLLGVDKLGMDLNVGAERITEEGFDSIAGTMRNAARVLHARRQEIRELHALICKCRFRFRGGSVIPDTILDEIDEALKRETP